MVNPHASLLSGAADFETPAEIDGLLDDYFDLNRSSPSLPPAYYMGNMSDASQQQLGEPGESMSRRHRMLYDNPLSARKNILGLPTSVADTDSADHDGDMNGEQNAMPGVVTDSSELTEANEEKKQEQKKGEPKGDSTGVVTNEDATRPAPKKIHPYFWEALETDKKVAEHDPECEQLAKAEGQPQPRRSKGKAPVTDGEMAPLKSPPTVD